MKSFSDMSFSEKQKIEEGRVNPLDYLSDCTFQVKQEVEKGIKKKENIKDD